MREPRDITRHQMHVCVCAGNLTAQADGVGGRHRRSHSHRRESAHEKV